VPTLIIHGDDDQMVPIDASARAAERLIRNARLRIYSGASHGLPVTHREQFNADLLAFLKE
jgi:non-heme chloroperoxidase